MVYGHTPTLHADWVNNTICIDTGCVFGGKLTAVRWPEKELVDVPAERTWFEPIRPLDGAPAPTSAQADADIMLDIQDVTGRRWIDTELKGRIVVAEENASAALEVMSRFALGPQWLAYLPPTMSPGETSAREGWLERPEEAFAHFRDRGVTEVVCEEKHMGSRAVIAICRSDTVATKRFGAAAGESGAVWTRAGRAFFGEPTMTENLLTRLRASVDAIGLWGELGTDWLLIDAEIMPWSAKAGSLIENQYGPVAASSRAGFSAAAEAFQRASSRGVAVGSLELRYADRAHRAALYGKAWEPYVWPVSDVGDLKVAPFHLLASEGRVWSDHDHVWHMTVSDRLAVAGDGAFTATHWRMLPLKDRIACSEAISWWEALTAAGGEGMVVKPREFVAFGRKGLIQPALKVRGREYLRIIYGPEYDAPSRTQPRRQAKPGSQGVRVGSEALKRFVAGEPLRRTHECVFAVLALESEPIDPRL